MIDDAADLRDPADAIRVAEIEHLLDTYARCWNESLIADIAHLWERSPDVSFIADELGDLIVGWKEISYYYGRVENRVRGAEFALADLRVRILSDDVAVATYVASWRVTRVEADGDERWTAHARVSTVFRCVAGDWRIAQMMEDSFYAPD